MNKYMNQNYEIIGMAMILILCAIPVALLIFACLDWLRSRIRGSARRRWLFYAAIAANVIFAACLIDAFIIEPRTLTITRIAVECAGIRSDANKVKIVHISDLHFEKSTALTGKVLASISRESPDLICVTGDMYQMGEYDLAGFKSFMTRLCDIAPTYFVCGYDDEQIILDAASGRALFADVRGRILRIRNTEIEVAGMGGYRMADGPHRYGAESDLKVMLSHSPDALDEAARNGADLFLAGHTHGGQIRLPVWGAVITNCETGKRYEYGLYKKGKLNAFVTRGIGLEPRPAPQARFLCRPEVVVISVR